MFVASAVCFVMEASEDRLSSKSTTYFSFEIILIRAYKASGSLRISSKGEPFFLGLVEGLTVLADVETSASASSTFCTGVAILNVGEALGEEKSLVTLLMIDWV